MEIKHQKQWEFLKNKFEAGQLGHAYLLSGKDSELRSHFAKEFIKFINCLSQGIDGRQYFETDKKSCDECQNCRMIERGAFPDLSIVKSINSESSVKNEKDMMSIEVDQIREVQIFLSYKSYYSDFSARGGSAFGGKFVIIEDAERMTIEAQNCFLKNLEEPKGETIIFLISSKPDLLLPTIASRCQEIKFFQIGKQEFSKEDQKILNDLISIVGSDLATKFQYVKNLNLERDNLNKILEILQRYFRELLLSKINRDTNIFTRLNFAKQNFGGQVHTLDPQGLPEFRVSGTEADNTNEGYSLEKLKKVIKLIENISRQSSIANINNKLALEVVLLEL